MPIYDFQCLKCGEVCEQWDFDGLDPCPCCGAPTLERLMSAPSFQLKGDGWFAPSPQDSENES